VGLSLGGKVMPVSVQMDENLAAEVDDTTICRVMQQYFLS
jgi:hypothetical protein